MAAGCGAAVRLAGVPGTVSIVGAIAAGTRFSSGFESSLPKVRVQDHPPLLGANGAGVSKALDVYQHTKTNAHGCVA